MAFYWFMDHKPEVLCWNVRGLNNLGKRKAVRAFVEAVKVNLVCFQETKLHVIDQYDVMQCVRPYFDGFSYLPVSDTRGGVLLAWDSTVLDVDCLVLDTHSITGRVHTRDGNSWWITGVYGPQGDDEKLAFLIEVSDGDMYLG